MATLGWPSDQVTGNYDGESNTIYEPAWQNLVANIHGARAGAVAGFAPTDNGDLEVRIGSGTACINGYYVTTDFNVDVNAIDNAVSYQYIKLKRNSIGMVIDPGVEAVSSIEAIRHPDYMLVAVTRASDGDIVYVNHAVEYATGILSGSYTGNGNVSRTIYIDPTLSTIIPTLVIVHSTSSTDNLYSWSAIESPYNRKYYNDTTSQSRVCLKSTYSEVNVAKILRGSQSWSISITAVDDSTKYDTVDVTVDGAATTNHVLVNYSDPDAYDRLFFNAYVVSTDTVRVVATSMGADAQSYSGTVSVCVVQYETMELGKAVFLSDSTSDLAPLITLGGFIVSDNDQEAATLNKTSVKYNYVAFV